MALPKINKLQSPDPHGSENTVNKDKIDTPNPPVVENNFVLPDIEGISLPDDIVDFSPESESIESPESENIEDDVFSWDIIESENNNEQENNLELLDKDNVNELNIEEFDDDLLLAMLAEEDESTTSDTGIEELDTEALLSLLREQDELETDKLEDSLNNSSIEDLNMDELLQSLSETEDLSDDFSFEQIEDNNNDDINESATEDDFFSFDNDDAGDFGFQDENDNRFQDEDDNSFTFDEGNDLDNDIDKIKTDEWEEDFNNISREKELEEDDEEDMEPEDELESLFESVSKKKPKNKKKKGKNKGLSLKSNFLVKGYMWFAGILYDFLTKLITILGKIPVIGRIFRPLNKVIKVGGKKYFPLIFLVFLIFIPFFLSVPSGVKMSLPDGGALETHTFSYSDDIAKGIIENTGDIVLTGEPIYNIYGFKPSLNPKTWITFSYLGSCQGDPIEIDISDIKEVSMKCIPEANGLFKKTSIEFEVYF